MIMRIVQIIIVSAALLISSQIKSQMVFSVQSGMYTSYLGEITHPGIGFGAGYRVGPDKLFKIMYQISYLHNAGKYENTPMDPGIVNENTNTIRLRYMQGLSVNMTNFGFDFMLIPIKIQRFSFDINLGLGLHVINMKYALDVPYSKEQPEIFNHREFCVGAGVGLGFEYILSDIFSLRLSPSAMISSSDYNYMTNGKYGLMTSLIVDLE